jgi:hypothetical protein
MDLGDGRREVVDPEVRAYVLSLVSAVRCHLTLTSLQLTRL